MIARFTAVAIVTLASGAFASDFRQVSPASTPALSQQANGLETSRLTDKSDRPYALTGAASPSKDPLRNTSRSSHFAGSPFFRGTR